MALFEVAQDSARSPADAWSRLTDWPAHGRFVPLTTVRVTTPGPTGVGTVFVARTGLARIGFDDPMQIVSWQPPSAHAAGACRLEKRGRVMLGWAELSVTPTAHGCRVTWREDIRLAHLPALADRPTAASSRLLFGRVLRGLLA